MNVENAIQFMKEKHNGQTRKQGTPYYTHPLAVYSYLKDRGYNEEYQITALFHDLLEDTDTTYEEIKNLTNEKIADAVRLLTKEENYQMDNYISRIKNNSLALPVKLADRIHNLKEGVLASTEFKNKYIEETEKYYLDLANGTLFKEDLEYYLDILKNSANNSKL